MNRWTGSHRNCSLPSLSLFTPSSGTPQRPVHEPRPARPLPQHAARTQRGGPGPRHESWSKEDAPWKRSVHLPSFTKNPKLKSLKGNFADAFIQSTLKTDTSVQRAVRGKSFCSMMLGGCIEIGHPLKENLTVTYNNIYIEITQGKYTSISGIKHHQVFIFHDLLDGLFQFEYQTHANSPSWSLSEQT